MGGGADTLGGISVHVPGIPDPVPNSCGRCPRKSRKSPGSPGGGNLRAGAAIRGRHGLQLVVAVPGMAPEWPQGPKRADQRGLGMVSPEARRAVSARPLRSRALVALLFTGSSYGICNTVASRKRGRIHIEARPSAPVCEPATPLLSKPRIGPWVASSGEEILWRRRLYAGGMGPLGRIVGADRCTIGPNWCMSPEAPDSKERCGSCDEARAQGE